jgi:hypothetical protein
MKLVFEKATGKFIEPNPVAVGVTIAVPHWQSDPLGSFEYPLPPPKLCVAPIVANIAAPLVSSITVLAKGDSVVVAADPEPVKKGKAFAAPVSCKRARAAALAVLALSAHDPQVPLLQNRIKLR